MCRVIAVSNQKGGVGKTVSCVNLGIGLAQEGKKVLMIDADPQGSLTISLGYEEPDEMEYSLATLMMNIVNDEKLNIEKTILHHKEGVDLIPANIELSAIEVSLVNAMSRELILRSMVDRLREFYDYIIIDCMPSLGMMTINALACADSVLIPVQAAYLPVKGLQQLIKTIGRVKKQLNPKGRPVFDADGEPVKEKVEVTIRAFKVVKTFDLSQTDGKELPTIGPSELVGNIEGYPKLLQALQEISPVPVSFELIDGDAKGFYHLEDKKIVVQDGMSEVQTIKTLLHEMAHQKLHDKDNVPEAKDISRNGKEVEAESVAYVVCQHYGINTSDYSFSYVAGWSEGKETPELKASLDKIRQTASEFIYQIDQKMEVLMADKKQVQESAKAPSPFVQELMDKITEGAKDLGFIPVAPETQEKTANPELKVVVDKALKDLDKKRTLSKVKESVKSKLKANTEKAEQAPKKSRTSKAKEERA